LIQNELYDRKLTDLVVDIATEGRGAVTGAGAEALREALEPPKPSATDDGEEVIDVESMVADTPPVDSGEHEVSAEAIEVPDDVAEAEPAQPSTDEPPAEPVAASDLETEVETEDSQPA
jgi:hypothetical protein